MTENEQWYTNKQLFEKMQELTVTITELQMELTQTTTKIRDYNGLREKITTCERKLFEMQGKAKGGKDVWGYVVGVAGIAIAVISKIS